MLLFVSIILVKIIIHSYNFHVKEVIKTTFGSGFDPQTHQWGNQKQEKIIKTWNKQSILQIFGINTLDGNSVIQQWKTHMTTTNH